MFYAANMFCAAICHDVFNFYVSIMFRAISISQNTNHYQKHQNNGTKHHSLKSVGDYFGRF